jgi:hypothetical protein
LFKTLDGQLKDPEKLEDVMDVGNLTVDICAKDLQLRCKLHLIEAIPIHRKTSLISVEKSFLLAAFKSSVSSLLYMAYPG